jgi:hypothetical protein
MSFRAKRELLVQVAPRYRAARHGQRRTRASGCRVPPSTASGQRSAQTRCNKRRRECRDARYPGRAQFVPRSPLTSARSLLEGTRARTGVGRPDCEGGRRTGGRRGSTAWRPPSRPAMDHQHRGNVLVSAGQRGNLRTAAGARSRRPQVSVTAQASHRRLGPAGHGHRTDFGGWPARARGTYLKCSRVG